MMEWHIPTTTEKLPPSPSTSNLFKPGKSTLIARETYDKMDHTMIIDNKIHDSIDICLVNVLAWALYSGLEIENYIKHGLSKEITIYCGSLYAGKL